MDNRELIDAFTTHLGGQKGYPNLEVDRWPDEENRQSPEIDALAGPFAIEHTSIDALPDQRRADDWYSRIVAGLDREIASFVDCESTGFTIALEFNAIRAGMDWNRIRADLKRWISKHASCLSHGSHSIILPTPTPADSPIVMMVRKDRSGCQGFSRIEPRDNSLATRVRELLDRKATKLMRYQTAHTSTILLVENGDIALMDDWKMLTAIREAYPDGLPKEWMRSGLPTLRCRTSHGSLTLQQKSTSDRNRCDAAEFPFFHATHLRYKPAGFVIAGPGSD